MKFKPLLLSVSIASLLVASCGGDDKKGSTEKKAKANTEKNAVGCEKVQTPKAKKVKKRSAPTFKLDPSKQYVASVETSCGTFEITLDAKQAPKTGGSFVTLVKEGFYDGLGFHRIVPGFVIQGGDPAGNGSGGPGYSVREAPPSDITYSEGVVAMAKTGADPAGTSGSQFYVVTGADAGLPAEYALLGKVTKGMKVAFEIENSETNPGDETPVDPIVIEKITVKTS